MWKLFDFNSDGKTSLFEKVVGLEVLESIIHDENAIIDESKSNDDETDEDDFDEIDDDDNDFEDEDEF